MTQVQKEIIQILCQNIFFFQNQSLFCFNLLLNNEESKKIHVVDFSDLSDGRMLDMRPADCKTLFIRGLR